MIDKAKLAATLNVEEGRRKAAYKDSLGYLTIAVGRLIDARKGGGLREIEIDFLLTNDIDEYEQEIAGYDWFAAADTEPRQRALLDMYFELRFNLLKFKKSLAAIRAKDWVQAGKRLRQSLWYRQVPDRAERLIRILETGVDQ